MKETLDGERLREWLETEFHLSTTERKHPIFTEVLDKVILALPRFRTPSPGVEPTTNSDSVSSGLVLPEGHAVVDVEGLKEWAINELSLTVVGNMPMGRQHGIMEFFQKLDAHTLTNKNTEEG